MVRPEGRVAKPLRRSGERWMGVDEAMKSRQKLLQLGDDLGPIGSGWHRGSIAYLSSCAASAGWQHASARSTYLASRDALNILETLPDNFTRQLAHPCEVASAPARTKPVGDIGVRLDATSREGLIRR